MTNKTKEYLNYFNRPQEEINKTMKAIKLKNQTPHAFLGSNHAFLGDVNSINQLNK